MKELLLGRVRGWGVFIRSANSIAVKDEDKDEVVQVLTVAEMETLAGLDEDWKRIALRLMMLRRSV